MNSILRFAIIFSIFAIGNCQDEDDKRKFWTVPIRVRREPPHTVEFEFSKAVQIEPISLKVNDMNFQLSEENNIKKFRNTAPMQQEQHQAIKIILEYREPEKDERKVQSFLYSFRDNFDEVITVRIEIPLSKTSAKSVEPMENNGRNTFVVPLKTNAESNVKTQNMIYKAMADDLDISCENGEGYAEKLLDAALRHGKIGTRLLLKGVKDDGVNPVDAISEIIATKLELPHLEYKILQAKFIDNDLLFEMESPRDAVEILNKKDTLNLQDQIIEPTTQSFYDLSLDVRSGF